jgi:hypothetical protein
LQGSRRWKACLLMIECVLARQQERHLNWGSQIGQQEETQTK